MGLNVVVLVGSVRSDRQGIKAARFVQRALTRRGHDVSLVDPVELQLPLLDRMYKEYSKGAAPEPLEKLAALYRSADAFVGVRATMQLRAMLCELGMPSIPSLFPIPRVQTAFDDAGDALDSGSETRFARFASELEWYASAM